MTKTAAALLQWLRHVAPVVVVARGSMLILIGVLEELST